MTHTSYPSRSGSINLHPSFNQFLGSTLILEIFIVLAIRRIRPLEMNHIKIKGPLLSTAKRFACETSPKVFPLHDISEQVREG
jgi:hypothetical protein